jgi:hypothetical protein
VSACSGFAANPKQSPGIRQGIIREPNFTFKREESVRGHEERSRTTHLLEAVCEKLVRVESKLDDARAENKDLKRRLEACQESVLGSCITERD